MGRIREESFRATGDLLGIGVLGAIGAGIYTGVTTAPSRIRAAQYNAEAAENIAELKAIETQKRVDRARGIVTERYGDVGSSGVGYSSGMTRQERNAFAREEQQYNASMANYNKDIIQAIGQNLILAQNLPVGDQRRQAYVDQAMAAAQNLVKDGGFIVEPIAGRAQTATVDIGIDGQSFRYTSRKSDNFQDNKRLVEDIAKDAARQIGGTPIHFSELGLPDAAPQASVTPSRQGSVSAYTHALAKRESAAQSTPAAYVPSGNSLPLGSMGGVDPKSQFNRFVIDAVRFAKTGEPYEQQGITKNAAGLAVLPEGRYPTGELDKDNKAIFVTIPKDAVMSPENVHQYIQAAITKAGIGKEAPAKAPPVNTPPAASKADATPAPATGGNTKTVFNPDAQAPAKVQTSSAQAAAPAPRERDYTDKSIPAAALQNGSEAKPYGIKKEYMPDGLKQNQVKGLQEMLKAASYDVSYTGKDGKKHDGLDGQFGEKSLKALQAACDAAGVKMKDVNFANPTDPEFIKLQAHLNTKAREQAPFKDGVAQTAHVEATLQSPLTNAATVATVAALETVAPVAVASAPAVTIPELAPAPAPMPAPAAAPSATAIAAVPAGDELETIAVTMARAAQQGIAPTQAQLERVNDLLKERGDDAPGALASIAKKLEALGLEQAQPNQAPVEQSAPAVVPTPAPVIQQTAFVPAAAANEPSPFATASFGFGAASFGDNAPAPVSFGGQQVNLEQAIAQARNAPAAGSVSAEFRSAPPAPNAGFDEKSMQRT